MKRDHCGMRGHLKEGCYKIIGYPGKQHVERGKGPMRYVTNVEKQQESHIKTLLLMMSHMKVEVSKKKGTFPTYFSD